MESQMFNQWVQAQIPETSQQNAAGVVLQHETARSDDWSKERSHSVANLTGTGLTDLSEFTTLAELPGSSTNPPPPYFNPYLTPSVLNHFSSLNTIPYGAWPSTPTPIPVSSYSSLNGATTATTSQSSQQPPQQSQQNQNRQSQQADMTIDPFLTLNGPSQTFPQSSSPTVPSQQSQNVGTQRTYSFSQPLLYAPYYRPQIQQQSPQGTLSPQALHMPMMQSTFYSHPQSQQTSVTPSALTVASINPVHGEALSPPNSGPALKTAPASGPTQEEREERKRKFLNGIRAWLQSSAFSGAQTVQHLTDRIADFGIADVDAQTRLDILARIRDGAGNHYYRAWSENSLAVEITREWIKAAAKDDSGALQETIMPLLHLIDRLPFNLESLAASKLGKVIKNLGKGERSAAIKDMASNLERRWRDMLEEDNSKEDTKKRKGNDPTTSNKGAAPVKKAAVGGASSLKPVVVKKETRSTAPPVKDAKADSSFFSAPKPKAKLPTFKKAVAAGLIKKEDTTTNSTHNVSQPSNFDPFQEALKSMKVAKRDSPAVSTPPPQSSSSADSTDAQNASATLKKKKSVTWAPDGKLESIKLIERAVYDDDPTETKYGGHSFRDLDREEGAALHARLFEEAIDWYDPFIIQMPPDSDPNNPRMPRGHASQEMSVQEEREQTALSAVYTPTQIPDSPTEPSTALSEEEVDKDVKTMQLGDEMESLFYPAAPAVDPSMSMSIDSSLNVSQLIGQLSSTMSNAMDTTPHQPPAVDLTSVAAVQNLQPDQLQQLLAQISSTMGVAGQQQFGQYDTTPPGLGGSDAASSGWGSTPHHFSDYAGYTDEGDKQYLSQWEDSRGGRVGRGRGGGRGGRDRSEEWGVKPYSNRKSRPCLFFQQQRCKYGDQCDFLHELVPTAER